MQRIVHLVAATFLICGMAVADDNKAYEIVEGTKSSFASMIANDLRRDVSDGVYGDKFAGLNQAELVSQISNAIASCHVDALVQLSEDNSIDIEDVFPSPDVVNKNFFSHQEINEKTENCARNAFENAGIEYN